MAYVLRTSGDPARLTAQVRAAVASVDPQLPLYDIRPMDDYVRAALSVRRFTTALAIAFASAALVLTGFGIYGLLAYTVEVRRREFGVRRALGSGRAQITRTALGEVMVLTKVGCASGLAVMTAVAVPCGGQRPSVRWMPCAPNEGRRQRLRRPRRGQIGGVCQK